MSNPGGVTGINHASTLSPLFANFNKEAPSSAVDSEIQLLEIGIVVGCMLIAAFGLFGYICFNPLEARQSKVSPVRASYQGYTELPQKSYGSQGSARDQSP